MKGNLSTRIRKKAMVKAMKSNLGNVSASTNAVGIDRSLHYKWMKSDENYKYIINENLERSLDFVEAALLKSIQAGNTTSIIFYLKTKGKSRGYGQTYHNLNTKIERSDLESKTQEELLAIINRNI
nr:hypothetical protein [uncultured Psychroserpens sp.]